LNFNDKIKLVISCILVGITSFICIKFYYSTSPNAWEVYIDSKPAAYVKNKEDFINAKEAAEKEVAKKLTNVKVDTNLSFERIRVPDELIWNEESIETLIDNRFKNTEVEAIEVSVEGSNAAVVGDNSEVNIMLDELKKYNVSRLGLKSITASGIENSIRTTKIKSKLNTIIDGKTAARNIEANKDLFSLLKFKVSGVKETTVPVYCAVNIIWSDSVGSGQSVVKTPGSDGAKVVTKEVTYINDKVINEKALGEKIIKKPVDKVITKGKSNPAVAEVLALGKPSRGAITSYFGKRWGRMHYGVDIAANMGTPINAAMDGTVQVAGWESGYGNVIKINHSNGTQTIYGHCSKLFVKSGQNVKKGQKIGAVGSTGNSTGPHLHFEVRVKGKPVNPISYIN
jgi:murein DD-endopeptidase MepM/ murein hydrolase activator NlpD